MAEVVKLGSDIAFDRSSIVQRLYEYLDENAPGGYEPHDLDLDNLIINGFGQEENELAALLEEFGEAVFRYYGLKVAKVQREEAAPAATTTKWTATDTLYHLIPAGTELSIDGVGFQTTADAEILGGESTAVTGVPIVAITPGSYANGLSGTPEVRDSLPAEFTVELEAATSAGKDEETDEAYVERLVEEMKLLARSCITSDDFVRLGKLVTGVGRLLAINLYNAATKESNKSGCITLIPTNDTDGKAVAPKVKETLEKLAGERRVLPIQVFVVDADYQAVDIEATVRYWPGYEPDTVQEQIEALLQASINPLTFGSPQQGESEQWVVQGTLTLYQVAGIIERSEGAQGVKPGTLKLNGEAKDIVLTGIAPLPEIKTLTLTLEPA